uniref:Uncharacterized protein n=1 Tax=Theileria annulata TaxID=5874 RepID=A0A3B0NI47_THEAN
MQAFNNVPLSQELHFPEQSTIRRYYVETNQNNIQQDFSIPLQDDIDSFKFYVVARRNYSVDVPFVIPRFFTQFNSDFGLFSPSEETSNDFFDRGITSTEDAEVDDSPFPSSKRTITHSKPSDPKPVTQAKPTILDNLRDTVDILQQSFNRISNKLDNIPLQQYTSRRKSNESEIERDLSKDLKLQRRRSRDSELQGNLSKELKLQRKLASELVEIRDEPGELRDKEENPDFSSHFQEPFGESEFDDISGSYPQSPHISPGKHTLKHLENITAKPLDNTIPPVPLRTGKVGRPKGSTKSISNTFGNVRDISNVKGLSTMKSVSGKEMNTDKRFKRSDTSNVLYKLNRKGSSLSKKGHGKLKGVKKTSTQSSRRSSDLKSVSIQSLAEISIDDLGDKHEFGGEVVPQTPTRSRTTIGVGTSTRGRKDRRSRRPSINSSSLLNSLYIYKRTESDASDWPYEHESVTRSVRYPKRSRLPPSQHWASNVISDGSSVVFLAGVSKADKRKKRSGNAFGNDMPESSLVLTRENGDVELKLVDRSAEDTPKLRRISTYLQTFSSKATSVPKRRGRPKKILTHPSTTTDLVPIGDTHSVPVADDPDSMPVGNGELVPFRDTDELAPMNNTDIQPITNIQVRRKTNVIRRGKVKITKDLSVDEALEILKDAPMIYDEKKGLEIAIVDESPKTVNEMADLKRRISRRKNFHQELLKPDDNFDSFVEDDVNRIYYKSLYPPYEETSQIQQCHIYPMVITHQIRTSILVIPKTETLSLGNIKTNFICGFVCSGSRIALKMDEEEVQQVQEKEIFFLSSFKHWSVENKHT